MFRLSRRMEKKISIHAPTRGATEFSLGGMRFIPVFQSTLPREERQGWGIPFSWTCSISIHAPTRGATAWQDKSGNIKSISIHAPTRGATITEGAWLSTICISIHAPTRGATTSSSPVYSFIAISIHAPTRGATYLRHMFNYMQRQFQSTLPREERHDTILIS